MAGTLEDQQQADQRPEVQVDANPAAVEYKEFAPRTNSVLQLAGALGDISPEARQASEASGNDVLRP